MTTPLDNPFSSRPNNIPLTGVSYNFITQSMKSRFLETFEGDLDDATRPIYVFYGQSVNWGSSYLSPNSTNDSPVIPTNAFKDDINVRRNMTALSRLTANNTNVAFRKRSWESGKVYGQYEVNLDQSASPNNNYYVFQGRVNLPNYGSVYKCLDNNGGGASTQPPHDQIQPSIRPVTLRDGYKWKYMFTVPGSLLSQFNTNQSPNPDFAPLYITDDWTGSIGTIDRVDISSPGVNYSPSYSADNGGWYGGIYDTPVTPIFVDGDGDTVESTRIRIKTVTNGSLVQFYPEKDQLINAVEGDSYTTLDSYPKLNNWVPVKFIEDSSSFEESQLSLINNPNRKTATGLAKITLSDNGRGIIDSPGDIKILNGGSNYQSDTLVKVVQSSTLAYATQYDSNHGIKKVTIFQDGSSHTQAKLIPVHTSPGPVGFIGQPIISPLQGHGGDPKKELNANSIFITKSIIGNYEAGIDASTLDFSRTNDFRQVGLIQTPRKFAANDLATDETLTAKHVLSVIDNAQGELAAADLTGAIKDLKIVGNISRAEGRIVDMFSIANTTTKTIRYIKIGAKDFLPNEYLLFSGITTPIRINSANPPEVDVYSGNILYINNNEVITRDKQQTETINFLIQF
jgi:hypothetical protein